MSDELSQIEKDAIAYARKNKKRIARELTDVIKYPKEEHPVTVFMAGSPGAGKTESAKNLINFLSNNGHLVIRIDPDDIRELLPGYDGTNSSYFQSSTSIVVDAMQDRALAQKQSYVFDGTLSNYERARQNISRNINKGREIFIMYVYQDPFQAWEFVKARAKRDGRIVPRDSFIHQYFRARLNVNKLKNEFGDRMKVYLVVKSIDGSDLRYYENIARIDDYVPDAYSEETLRQDLSDL